MSRQAKNVGTEFADKYLGHEDNIVMSTQDARYRYYQWLRGWYGLGQRMATNKCPFYQFMFWGSILLLVSLVPLVVLKVFEWFVLKPSSWVVPKLVHNFYEKMNASKMITSWMLTLGLVILASLFSFNVITYIGFGLFYIFAVPAWILQGIWWLIVEGIPVAGIGIVWFLGILGDGMMVVFHWPWLGILYTLAIGLGALVGLTALFIILYKLATWFFQSSPVKWIITKSCKVRDVKVKKQEDFKKVLAERQAERKRAKRARLERRMQPVEETPFDIFLRNFFRTLWKVLRIFPGQPLKWIGLGFTLFGKGLWLLLGVFVWILQKIGDFFVVVWALFSETISNHCPPIDFIGTFKEYGKLVPYADYYIFTANETGYKYIVLPDQLPEGFKPSRAKAGKDTYMSYEVDMKVLEHYKRYKDSYYPTPGYVEIKKVISMRYLDKKKQ